MVLPNVIPFEALVKPEEWVKAASRKDCSMCMTKFTAFKRRHHCRMCGDIVCATCFVKRKAKMPMVGLIEVKICSSCVNNDNLHSRRFRDDSSSTSETPDEVRRLGSFGSRSVLSDDLSSSFFKSVRVSEATSTYSSSVFSVSSLNLGQSADDLSSLAHDGSVVDENDLGAGNLTHTVEEINAKWLQEVDLQPLRLLSDNSARYDITVMRHLQGELLMSKQLNEAHITDHAVEQFIDVVELVSQLHHPHILDFVGVAWSAGHRLQALYEYLPRGDLRSFLDATARDAKTRQERSRNKLQMALDIAEALVHLHSFSPPIVHGSLDSGEVLLTKEYRAKLGGIGATADDRVSKKSRRWQAPEVVSNSGVYLTSSDVYAFGVILCELDTHQIPYSDCLTSEGEPLPEIEIEQMVARGELQPTISRDCPPELRRLASDCLAFDPKDRPTAVEITVRLRMFIRSYGLENQAHANAVSDGKKKAVELYDQDFSSSHSRNPGVTF